MSRRTHYRRRSKEVLELDMTTFLNLMVVLVPFLLITAVFSRITVIELSLPTSEGAAAAVEPSYRVEVIVRDAGLELTDGSRIIAKIPKVEEAYDLRTLSDHVVALKRSHPDDNDASVLLEPDIEYDHLIQVMDVLRSVELPAVDDEEPQRMALFSDVSIGDAP